LALIVITLAAQCYGPHALERVQSNGNRFRSRREATRGESVARTYRVPARHFPTTRPSEPC
jgi:hypothetical protein